MLIKGFHHLKIDVEDLDASLDFYLKRLEFEIIVRYDLENGGTIVQVSPDGHPPGLELWHQPPHRAYFLERLHFALAVYDTYKVIEILRARDVIIEREPFRLGHETIAFVRDPDGYLIEIYEDTALA